MTEGRNSVSRDSRNNMRDLAVSCQENYTAHKEGINKKAHTSTICVVPEKPASESPEETWPVATISNEDTVDVFRITVHSALEDKPDKRKSPRLSARLKISRKSTRIIRQDMALVH